MLNVSTLTGSYTVDPVGRGTITLKVSPSATLTFAFSQVSPTELLVISGDHFLRNGSSGRRHRVATNRDPQQCIAHRSECPRIDGKRRPDLAVFIPDVTLGLLTSDGNGNLTATYDEYKAALLAPQTYTATYAVDAATGRTPITASGTPPILYLVSNAKAFVVGTDASASSGLLEVQSGSSFTNASLKGNYLGGTIPWPDLQVVSLIAADGAGNVQTTSDSSGSTGLAVEPEAVRHLLRRCPRKGTPSPPQAMRRKRIFYVVSPTRTVLLSGEAGGYLSPASSNRARLRGNGHSLGDMPPHLTESGVVGRSLFALQSGQISSDLLPKPMLALRPVSLSLVSHRIPLFSKSTKIAGIAACTYPSSRGC